MFAAWQAGAAFEAPTLEARDGSGRWHVVAREFGYPAGMPRQMAYPLPPLPARDDRASPAHLSGDLLGPCRRRLRGVAAGGSPTRPAPAIGDAGRCGVRAPHHRTAAHAAIRRCAAARRSTTRATRAAGTSEFGGVEALVADEDSALAILGPGEAVDIAFEAPGAAAPAGWSRALVLEARGLVQGHGSLHARRRDDRAAPRRRHRGPPAAAPAVQYEVCGRVLASDLVNLLSW